MIITNGITTSMKVPAYKMMESNHVGIFSRSFVTIAQTVTILKINLITYHNTAADM